MLYSTGLRRSEIVKLTLADVEDGKLTIRGGKGRKDRTVYVTGGALLALADWLEARGKAPGALFVPVNKGGNISFKPLSSQAIYMMVEKRAWKISHRTTFGGRSRGTCSMMAGHRDGSDADGTCQRGDDGAV